MTKPVGVDRAAILAEVRGLVLAGWLAALAGIVDAIGYLHLGGLFVSYMSGNSTQLAVAIGQGSRLEAGAIAELIALFVLGAAAGQVLADLTGRWHMTWVLAGVTILLAVAGIMATAAEPMVLAMGALNASMRRAGNIPVSLTFVTGVLVRFGQGLGDFLDNRNELARASRSLDRTYRWSDIRDGRLRVDRRSRNLVSGRPGRPAHGLLGSDTRVRLKEGVQDGACLCSHDGGKLPNPAFFERTP